MAYTTIDDPSAFFQAVTYTGNEQARDITFNGNSDMQPDWVWAKIRSQAYSHRMFDSVRGTGKFLHTDGNDAEGTQNANVSAFNSNGFSLGNDNGINSDGDTHVAWNWKAGTSFTNDASSTSVGTIDSAGSVSTDAGFSIMTYTGTGSNGTVAHGLGAVPKMYIVKKRNATSQWYTYHAGNTAAPETDYLDLESTAATSDSAVNWNDTSPTSTTFSLGTNSNVNNSGNTYVAYIFAEKKGYSKFGSYVGTEDGSGNNGSFVYLGFKPAFLMIKSTSITTNWVMLDNKRDGFNENNNFLYANLNNVENDGGYDLDLLSNGFKIRHNLSWINEGALIYMAFAESPFVTSTGVPGTAR